MKFLWNVVTVFSLMLVLLLPVPSEARRVKEGDPVKIDFDPALKGGVPSLSVEPLDREEPFSGEIHITAYAWDDQEIVLEEKVISGLEKFEMELPHRDREEVFGVRVEIVEAGLEPKKMAEWRARYFPKGQAMNYKGSRELGRPRDFRKYWKEARQKLALVPMSPKMEPAPEKETATGKLYKVTLNSYLNIPIVCWYYVPKEVDIENPKPGQKFPAIQIMPGWGAEEPPIDRTAEGYITLSLNPRSHGPSKDYFTTPIAHHVWNIDQPEDFYYRMAYMDCIRGIDFLASRPEVDAGRIGVEGSSQGGAFSIAVGALDGRVSAVAASVPYLSCFPDFAQLSTLGSGNIFMDKANDPDIGQRVSRTLGYIDIANLVQDIHVPTLITVGAQDPVCPPLCGIIAYNRLDEDVPSKLVIDPDAEHEYSNVMRAAHREWFGQYLKGGNCFEEK